MFEPLDRALSQARPLSPFRRRWDDAPAGTGGFAPLSLMESTTAAPGDDTGAAQMQETALHEAYAEGFAAGRADVDGQLRASAALAAAMSALRPVAPSVATEPVVAALIAIVRDIVGAAPVDAALLAERCAAAIDQCQAATSATLHVHPDDAVLLLPHGLGVAVAQDPAMPRGTAQLAYPDGAIWTGVQPMLEEFAAHLTGTDSQ